MEQWDGTERRIGDGDRRKGQRVRFVEYPKMVNGVTVNSADEEQSLRDDWTFSDDAETPKPKSRKPAGRKK